MDRRNFLKWAGAGAAAATVGLEAPKKARAAGETAISVYNKLGKTDIKMSDISFGAGNLKDPLLVHKAIDLGINYFDTAPDYGESEATLGKVFKSKEKREKVFVATKMCRPEGYPGHHKPGTKAEVIVKGVEDSLKRMNTDYTDIIMLHALGEKYDYNKRLKDEELYKALDKLKKSGMARYTGVSSHGPLKMDGGLKMAIRSGQFDVIQPAFNHLQHEKLNEALKLAAEKGIGVIAMKTLGGDQIVDLGEYEEEGAPHAHACFKWVNSHPEVSGLIVTMDSVEKIKTYVGASGKKLGKRDMEILQRYAKAVEKDYCRTGCGDCVGSCPIGAAIPQVLRYDMYFTNYHQERDAMERYAALPKEMTAQACLGCDAPCDGSCSYGLNIQEKMIGAHRNLSFPTAVG